MTLRPNPLGLLSGNRRMQISHIWFDIGRDITDLEFTRALKVFLEKLRVENIRFALYRDFPDENRAE